MLDNREYYNAFSHIYDQGREKGYIASVYEGELNIIEKYVRGKSVLEAGCGTGLMMEKIQRQCREIFGIDIAPGMLEKARKKTLSYMKHQC